MEFVLRESSEELKRFCVEVNGVDIHFGSKHEKYYIDHKDRKRNKQFIKSQNLPKHKRYINDPNFWLYRVCCASADLNNNLWIMKEKCGLDVVLEEHEHEDEKEEGVGGIDDLDE